MKAVPVAVPIAWTWAQRIYLQSMGIASEIRSDCLLHREVLR